ncbi:hypothetical protein RRG08_017408 [Elysia crispata]|uniref:Uncharacterized protein n=1 Tax=Elysia crispata TaxID=231223 RepID=A0AAE1DJB7_9GAST|nr:hypothetical protein RRG08_017408 [Elysia crispata]
MTYPPRRICILSVSAVATGFCPEQPPYVDVRVTIFRAFLNYRHGHTEQYCQAKDGEAARSEAKGEHDYRVRLGRHPLFYR